MARDTAGAGESVGLNEKTLPPDTLVPDGLAAIELGGVTLMTIWRWDRDPEMLKRGWPLPVKVKKRNYRSRRALEAFKARLFAEAARANKRRGRAA